MNKYYHDNGDGIFLVADTHFCHSNIIRFCGRPFQDSVEMDERLILRWNEVVPEDGIVYHLGDFAMGPSARVRDILRRLNGQIRLCEGSHDKSVMSGGNRRFLDAVADAYIVDIGNQKLFLSHYLHKVWPVSHYGSWHLYGHSHGGMNDYSELEGKVLDVGVDSHDFRPWTFGEVEEVMEGRPLNFNDPRRGKKVNEGGS